MYKLSHFTKNKLLGGLFLSALLMVFVACNDDEATDYENDTIAHLEIHFEESNALMRRTTPYTTTAQVGRRTYFFRDDNETANVKFINTVEGIIGGLEAFIEIPYTQLRIRHTSDPQDLYFSAIEVSLNFDTLHTFGWLTHILSRGELPMWLSAGLEAYVKEGLGLFVPNSYDDELVRVSDMAFLPCRLGTDEHMVAISSTYDIVADLSRNGELEGIISNPTQKLITLDLLDGSVVVMDDFGNSFHFFFDHIHNIIAVNEINNYVEYMQNAINFTVNFMGQFRDFEVTPLRTYIHYYTIGFMGGGYQGSGLLEIFGIRAIEVMAHEVVHAIIVSMMDKSRPILSLEEGFANYVNFHFNKSTDFQHQLPDESSAELIRSNFNRNYHYRYHFASHYRLTNVDYAVVGAGFPPPRRCPSYIDAINTYSTTTSFVIYLIQTYGIDNFMETMWDVAGFVNIYGKDIYELIEEWREWLYILTYNYEGDWEAVARFRLGLE